MNEERLENLRAVTHTCGFLGREFLTWLLANSCRNETVFGSQYFSGSSIYHIVFDGKVTLAGLNRGMQYDGSSPVSDKQFWEYLRNGSKVMQAHVSVLDSEQNPIAEFTLSSENLMPRSMKMTTENGVGYETHAENRIERYREIRKILSQLYERFFQERKGNQMMLSELVKAAYASAMMNMVES